MKPNNDYGQFCIIDEDNEEYTQQVIIDRDSIIKNELYFQRSPVIKVCVAVLYICNYIYELLTV